MKNFIAISVLLLVLFSSTDTYARIWRVNNTAGVVADFTTASAALTAATAGDTIHIEPSVAGYGNFIVNKPIVLIGNGNFLTEDTGLQVNTNSSYFGYVDFTTGSSGSTMQGIYSSSVYVEVANILVRRCYVPGYFYMYAGANNCTILGNFMGGVTEQSGPTTGLNISNNIIYNGGVSLNPDYTGTFENNTVESTGVNLTNFQVNNNIFNAASFTPNNCVYFNNIGNSTQFGNANGNQQNVTMANNVFVATGTTDGRFVLKAGSPAIGAGQGGVDCGAFGGPNPYKIAGIPNVPTIYKLVVPPTGTTNINVTISTKSNN